MTVSTGNAYLDSLKGTSTSDPTVPKKSNGTLGQGDFLKLLTTQMTTQDPFNPMDNTQMVAQMAQFSSVAGIAEMNQSLKTIVSGLQSSRVGGAASWIGKAALFDAKTATPLNDGSYAGTVTIPDDASRVDISLVDATGKVVYTGSATNVGKGDIPFYWDGKDQDGNAVPGPLNISVYAKDKAAQPMKDVATASWASVTSVSSPAAGTTKLITPLGTFDPTDALQLS
jgi:flagellar basal-body rod modification protein FlgD